MTTKLCDPIDNTTTERRRGVHCGYGRDRDRGGRRAMFLSYAVHYPQPDKVALLAQRMRDCGDVIKTQPGIIVVDAFRDATNGTLLALALWERMPPRYSRSSRR
jgi:hypothetical protein